MNKEKNITLFLMTEKGLNTLKAIVDSQYVKLIDKVITAQDHNLKVDYHEQIIELCRKNNITVYNKSDEYTINSKYSIAISWKWILSLDNTKLIILHDSILPKYRGFNPLVSALINGDNEIGVTALHATKNYDEGDIILQERISIDYPIKIQEAIQRVSRFYVKIVINLLGSISNNKDLDSQIQDHNNATYSLWRDNKDYYINWNWDAKKIKRFIDSVGFPYNGARTTVDKNDIIIEEAEVFDDVKIVNRDVGKIIFIRDGKPVVVCGEGLLLITNASYIKDGKSIIHIVKFRTRFE